MYDIGFQVELKNNILTDYFYDKSNSNNPLYIGLFVTKASANGPQELVPGQAGYLRQPITWTLPAEGMIQNDVGFTFGPASAPWTANGERITHIGIFDNSGLDEDNNFIDGGLLVYNTLTQDEQVNTKGSLVFNAGSISIRLP